MSNFAQGQVEFPQELVAAQATIFVPDTEPQDARLELGQLERPEGEALIELGVELAPLDGRFPFSRLAAIRQQVKLDVAVVNILRVDS